MSRKFRWTFEADFPSGKIAAKFCKVGQRPTCNIEEKEINFLGDKAWIPGKAEWEAITTTFYPTTNKEDEDLLKVIGTFYSFVSGEAPDLEIPEEQMGTAILKLWCPQYKPFEILPTKTEEKETETKPLGMGIGKLGSFTYHNEYTWECLEEWTLKKIWPSMINFGELDYSSSEEVTIEVSWKYKEVAYKGNVVSK